MTHFGFILFCFHLWALVKPSALAYLQKEYFTKHVVLFGKNAFRCAGTSKINSLGKYLIQKLLYIDVDSLFFYMEFIF